MPLVQKYRQEVSSPLLGNRREKRPGGLVLALPLLRGLDAEELEALDRWLVNGGHLLLLTSGERPGPVEMATPSPAESIAPPRAVP